MKSDHTNSILEGLSPASGLRPPSFVAIIFSILLVFQSPSYAEQKDWSNQGDQSSWTDDANWYMPGAPAEDDDAKVDYSGAAVNIPQSFEVKSLTIGGKKSSEVNTSNFVTGLVDPGDTDKDAVTARRSGHLILRGSTGTIKLKGAYKDSEEIIPDEPTFLLYAS